MLKKRYGSIDQLNKLIHGLLRDEISEYDSVDATSVGIRKLSQLNYQPSA